MAERQAITVLGSTGSIGVNTLDVIARHPERYEVFALAALRSVDTLAAQCRAHRPRYAVMVDTQAAQQLRARLAADARGGAPVTEVLEGADALCQVAADPLVDAVMAAIVGAAGMPAALAAARAGKRLMLANKEALVTAGGLFMRAVEDGGATLLPVDSEHSAIFQCLPADARARVDTSEVQHLLLTASGGPFRGRAAVDLVGVTADEACAHPNWSMGRKISVDSATLMNKGLELAEACWLFRMAPADVQVVVHPQSILHSAVQYRDGSVLAQLGRPDMRTPIAYALAWPRRVDAGVEALDLMSLARLDFEAPDEAAFPCLRIARDCIAAGGSAMAVCNAANEVAVAAFLEARIGFTDIPALIRATLDRVPTIEPESLEQVEAIDQQARETAAELLASRDHGLSAAGT
jgi:1-deoxy-D-xylulose-5-phosphate reductoisomerase